MVKAIPLCQPAQIYLVFIIITVILFIFNSLFVHSKLPKTHYHVFFMLVVIGVLLQLIYGFFITGVLDYLCKSGRENWSWFIIISMVVIALLLSFFGMSINKLIEKK